MKFVVNTNILFSFFKKGSITRELITKIPNLYTSEYCLKELRKYKEVIIQKCKISEKEFEELLNELEIFVKVIPLSEYKEKRYFEEAQKFSPDPGDINILALALKLNCPVWSNDKRLKKQKVIKVYSTKELIEEFRLIK